MRHQGCGVNWYTFLNQRLYSLDSQTAWFMPTMATHTKLPFDDHLVLLRKKWGCQRRVQTRLLSHPRTKRWKIIREDGASLRGFQERPAERTAVREGRHKHSLCIRKALSLLSLVAMLLKGRKVSKAGLKGRHLVLLGSFPHSWHCWGGGGAIYVEWGLSILVPQQGHSQPCRGYEAAL